MTIISILVATWADGLFVITGESRRHEFAGKAVRGLAPDGNGGTLAIIDGHSLCRRNHDGEWTTIATSESQLSCALRVGDGTYIGTDDARVLHVSAAGGISELTGFNSVPGRETWYAGSAVIDGRRLGPPLGIRSMTATSDGAVLLVNVHVGGIPRSTDGGLTWRPTVDVNNDVHEVRAHPTDPSVVIAAAANGLWVSRDSGATWIVEREGLHGLHCAAVAFSGDDLLVSAAADHFATESAVYRRAVGGADPLVPVGAGLPRWLNGIVDTSCIATNDAALAMADKAGNVYVSTDAGRSWARRADGLPLASSVLIV
ncbi:MAG: hypothetical protein ABJE10_24240 [bacterium]